MDKTGTLTLGKPQLTDVVTYSSGKHLVKAGLNIPDWSRRRNDDLTNAGGTFTFSTLQDYVAGRPFSFVQQRGDGHLVFLQKVLGGFVQDQITLGRNLSVALGLRYDWQNYFVDDNNFSPRASWAWAPGHHYEILSFASGYQPYAAEPGRDRWLADEPNGTAYASSKSHSSNC